nr:hypothetical protein [Tanacetum cinerariifolium]
MDNKKHIIDLELFKNILHICLRVHGQPFAEPLFKKEILAFIRFLRHSAAIRTLIDVNINKLYQPWRSFADLINKCLTGKSSDYDNLRLSQAQILWGLYHKRKINYAYLIWEDFVYQVEHKNQKKGNEMYYPRFTKAIIHHFMSKHQNTQQFGALLPIELTNDEIRNSKSYKEYYAIATGEAAPKPKASVRRTKSSSDTSITSPTATASPRLKASARAEASNQANMQQTYISQLSGLGTDEGTSSKPRVPDVPTDESEEELSWNSTDDKGDDNEEHDDDGDEEDEGDDGKEGNGDDDDADQEVVRDDDKDDDEKGDGEEDLGLNIGEDQRHDEEEEEDELYQDVNINQVGGLPAFVEVEYSHVILTLVKLDGMESIFETTLQLDVPTPTSVTPLPITTPIMTSSTIATTTTTTSQAPILPTTIPSDIIQNLPSFGSLFHFDDRLRSLEENFSEVMQTNQFAGVVSVIPRIVQHYMDQRMNEPVKIIKEQVKEQVKVQVSKILLRIKQVVNEQLEAEVLTRSSHSSRTSYAVAVDLSKMELKKIFIEKIDGNKSIQRSDEQRNLYKALVDAYASDKIILDIYGETVTLKRRRDDDEDKDEKPSAGPDRGSTTGSRSRQASASESAFAEEPVQTTSQMEEPSHLDTGTEDQPIIQSSQHPEWFSQPQKPQTPNSDWSKTLPADHESIQPWISELAKQADTRSSFNKLMDTPLDFSNFIMNWLRGDTLTLELLPGPTYDLMKGSCKSLIEIEYHLEEVYKATTDQLDWVNPEVEHKNQKKSNEMYYPRFTKVIIHHFMSKDPSIPRRNKVNWHYVRDDHMFSTIKLVSRHQNTQQFGALLPIELTNKEIRNSNAYKEYYAIATGAAPPKPKASARRTKSSSDTSITPPTTAASPRLTASANGKQTARASKAKSLSALFEVAMTEAQQLKLVTKRSMQQTHISQASGSGVGEGTGSIPGVLDAPTDESEEELSWNSTDDKGADNEGKDGDDDEEDEGDDGEEGNDDDDDQEVERDDDKDDDKDDEEEGGDDDQEYDDEYTKETRDEESFDHIPQTPKNSIDEGNGEEDLGLNVGGEEGHVQEEEEDEIYKDVNINQGRGIQANLKVEDSHVTLTPVNPNGEQQSSLVSSQFMTRMLNPTIDVGMKSIFETTSQMDTQIPTSVAPLPMTAPTMTPSTIATITTTSQAPILPTTISSNIIQNLPNFGSLFRFDDRLRSLESNFFKVAVQIQSASLRDEAQRENEEFLKTVDENMQKIIKEQVKEQVKVQVFKILPRIKQAVNEQLEAEVFTWNLYKALVEAYKSDKIILYTYGETVTLKRHRDDDADKDEEHSAGPDRESKRHREGKEPESTTSQMEEPSHPEFDTGAEDQPIVQSSQHPEWYSQQHKPPSLDRAWNKIVLAVHESIQSLISELAKQTNSCSSFNELVDTPLDFSNFLINQLKVDTLTPELLAGSTYELMKESCKSLVELEYHLEEVFKATTYQLDWVNPEGASSRKYTTSITKMKAADYGHIKWIEDLESARDVYSKRRIIAVTELKIVEWHSYKYLDWITVRRDDDKLYKFKEGNFKRLRIQDIEDMLLLLVQGKLTNLTNKDKRNRLMRIDELHKFSDGTLIDVYTTLDDRLKGIRMQYLPQSIWRKSDKDRAAAMIQAIDKRLKTRRIMRSLERFVG